MLHCVPRWLPQTETWLYNQVRYLPYEIENHIACETTENLDQFVAPNLHSFSEVPSWRYLWDKTLRKVGYRSNLGYIFQVAKQKQADILHSHFGTTGWSNAWAAYRMGLRHVVSFYGQDVGYFTTVDPRWRKRYASLFRLVDCVLCLGPVMAQRLIEMGCEEEKIRVHHLGVSVDEIEFQYRRWHPPEPLRVLIAASFREKKGIPYALEALGTLRKEVPLKITIVGDATEDFRSIEEKERIHLAIDKHSLRSHVRMLGYQPHAVLLRESYNHHIFLSPSITTRNGDSEGTPVTLMEMAASGLLIVSTVHNDIPEVVKDQHTGFLSPERDVQDLLQHFKWLIHNREKWNAISLAGRKHIESEFNAIHQGEALAKIYRQFDSKSLART